MVNNADQQVHFKGLYKSLLYQVAKVTGSNRIQSKKLRQKAQAQNCSKIVKQS